MIILFVTVKIWRNICGIFMRIRYVGFMMNCIQRNNIFPKSKEKIWVTIKIGD